MSLFRYAAGLYLLLIFFSPVRADYDTLIQHYRAGKIDSAITEAKALLHESPESSHYMYWLADLYSLQNQPDSSAMWLDQASEHGFTEYIAILHDRDFENALRSAHFRQVVHEVKKKLLADISWPPLGLCKTAHCSLIHFICPLIFIPILRFLSSWPSHFWA
jgi:hypothetical protein